MPTDRRIKKVNVPKKTVKKKVVKNTQKRAVKESFTSKRGHSIRYGKDTDSVAARRASIKKREIKELLKERKKLNKELKKEQSV